MPVPAVLGGAHPPLVPGAAPGDVHGAPDQGALGPLQLPALPGGPVAPCHLMPVEDTVSPSSTLGCSDCSASLQVQGCCPGSEVSQVLCLVSAVCLAWFLVSEVSLGWQVTVPMTVPMSTLPTAVSVGLVAQGPFLLFPGVGTPAGAAAAAKAAKYGKHCTTQGAPWPPRYPGVSVVSHADSSSSTRPYHKWVKAVAALGSSQSDQCPEHPALPGGYGGPPTMSLCHLAARLHLPMVSIIWSPHGTAPVLVTS